MKVKTLAEWFFVAAVVNFVLYYGIANFIGGHSLLGGGTAPGVFFLGLGGELTPVSETVYRYSLIHGWATLISLPVACVVVNIFNRD